MITREITVKLTAEETAKAFCSLDGDQQAQFFNHVHAISQKWEAPFCFQLQWITDSKDLMPGGRKIMEQIGEYSSPTEVAK